MVATRTYRAPCMIVLTLLAAFAHPAGAQDVTVVPGDISARIVSPTDPTQSYALYLPSAYDGVTPLPILFVLDPAGRALDALALFRDAAEARGWIVMSSYDTRSHGRAAPNVRAMNAMLGDARASFEIARDRLYIAGFSGTARLAWEFAAQLDGAVAGIFGASASAGELVAAGARPPELAFFGTAGHVDYNHDEMRRFERRLEAWRLPWRVRVFEGAHQWPPAELAAEGIDWFELQAMHNGMAPLDAAFVERMHTRDSTALDALTADEDPLARLGRARELAADYAGMRDTTGAAAILRGLRADARVHAALARDEALLEEAAAREARLIAYLERVRASDRPPAAADVLAALRVAELHDQAEGAEPGRARSIRRTLGQIFVATSFNEPRAFIENGRHEHALALLDVAAAIRADHPEILLQRARALSALGRTEASRAALEAALRAGLPIEAARADSLLVRVLRTPG